MPAPVPGTPSTTASPSTAARPSCTGTWAIKRLPVLVARTQTRVTGSTACTRPSSMAKGPTAADMLPQVPLQSTNGL